MCFVGFCCFGWAGMRWGWFLSRTLCDVAEAAAGVVTAAVALAAVATQAVPQIRKQEQLYITRNQSSSAIFAIDGVRSEEAARCSVKPEDLPWP